MQDFVSTSVRTLGQIRNFLTLLLMAILVIVLPEPHGIEGLQHYLPLHSLLETISICASTAIFAFCLNAQHFRGSNDIRWLAWIFLAVAILDFSHMISYPGMPDFVTPASADKTINFWLAARSFAAVGLFVVAARILNSGTSGTSLVMPTLVLGLVAVIHAVFLFYPDVMPHSFVPGTGLTTFKIGFEYVLAVVYVVAGLLFLVREPGTGPGLDTRRLADAALVMALSELMFTQYDSLNDIYILFGHILKVAAYMLLFRALFRETVREPYIALQRVEQERAAVLTALPDMILELDDTHRIRMIRHTQPRFGPIIDRFAPGRSLDACLGTDWFATLDAAFWMAQTAKTRVVARPFQVPDSAGNPMVFVLTLSRLDGLDSRPPGWLVVIRDDTESAQNRTQAERLSTVLSQTPLPLAIFDATFQSTFVNDSFRARAQFWNDQSEPPVVLAGADMQTKLERGRPLRREVTHTAADGTTLTEMQYAFPLLGTTGTFDGAMVFLEDITERRAAQERFERLMNYDELTGLPRESVLAERLKQAIIAPKSARQNAFVMRLNLDGFARVNDAYGRRSGDRVLRHLTETLRAALDPRALLSRENGDNLVILVLDLPTEEVPRLVNTILQVVNLPLAVGRETIRVTTCVGVASYPDDGATFDALSAAADAALHDAKTKGPGSWSSYSPTLREPVARFMTVSAHLADAIDANEFSLVFQPKMSADGAHLKGAEALLRWHSPTLGEVSPSEFIEVAEANGDIGRIGTWVFRATVATIARWTHAGRAVLPVSVNLSATEFEDPGIVEQFTRIVRQAGVDPALLEIELTERTLVRDPDAALETIKGFRRTGFGIALDDFGAGQTSLQYLTRFPMQTLKIDKSLVDRILRDDRSAAIVESVIGLAHRLAMEVVAEGVESAEQQRFLAGLNCDQIQGFLVSEPLGEDAFVCHLDAASGAPVVVG